MLAVQVCEPDSISGATASTATPPAGAPIDANGNLTSDGSKSYTWNARNQLASIAGAATASFQYDGLARRRSRTVSGSATQFLYDGFNPVQELTGGSPTANLLTGFRLDEFFARTDSGGTRNYLSDALSSTLALSDSAGAVQTQYTYEPFGSTATSGQANTNTLQYTGRENDGTGLYYYRARYYHPSLQRFTSEDPIEMAGGPHFYSYSANSPTTYKDPFGLITVLFGAGVSLTGVTGVEGSAGVAISPGMGSCAGIGGFAPCTVSASRSERIRQRFFVGDFGAVFRILNNPAGRKVSAGSGRTP